MSKWEDTVISDKELSKLLDERFSKIAPPTVPFLREVTQAQAEISWPIAEMTGMRKAMEWFSKYHVGDEIHTGETLPAGYYVTFRINKEKLQTQLREWFKDNPELLKGWWGL